jgi:hypothetical protein
LYRFIIKEGGCFAIAKRQKVRSQKLEARRKKPLGFTIDDL